MVADDLLKVYGNADRAGEVVSILIDQKEVSASVGERVLWVALREGVQIPHLCAMDSEDLAFGGCRLCLVETEWQGKRSLVTACSEPVRPGLKVITGSDRITRLRRAAFELIMSDHDIDCKNCPGKNKCNLIEIARQLKVGLRPKRLRSVVRPVAADHSHPLFGYDPRKCVKCGKCVIICERLGKSFLTFVDRGFEMSVSTFDAAPLAEADCETPFECVEICPTGALYVKKETTL